MVRFALVIAAAGCLATGQDSSERSVVVHIGDVTAPGSRTNRDTRAGAQFELPVTGPQSGAAVPAIQIRITSLDSPATLSFHDVSFDRRTFQAKVTLGNGTGTNLENARMLITRVREEFQRDDGRAGDAANKRYLSVDMAAPVVFGNVPNGAKSDEYTLMITGFHQNGATIRTVVEGIILNGRT